MRFELTGMPQRWIDWSASRVRWGLWGAACVAAAAAGAWQLQAGVAASRALAEATRAEAEELAHSTAADASFAAPPANFTHSLPAEAAGALSEARRLQALSAAAGVTISSLAFAQRAPEPAELGRLELEVELIGSYRALKQVLALWTSGSHFATVRSLRIAGDTANPSGALQAHVVLAQWSRPRPEGRAGGSAGAGAPTGAGR